MKKSHKLDEDDTSRKKDKYQYSSQKKDWSVDKMSEGNGFDKEMNLKSYEILKIKKEDSEKVKALSKNYSPIKKEKKTDSIKKSNKRKLDTSSSEAKDTLKKT